MKAFRGTVAERVEVYASARGLGKTRILGVGMDGHVFTTSGLRRRAVKACERVAAFRREVAIYRRLASAGVQSVHGHAVPRLLGSDDRLGIIEMSIVAPPFVLDFGKARLDESWELVFRDAPHVIEERWAHWESLFEPGQWPTVLAIYGELGRRHGIWLEDLHPGNIAFGP